MTQHDSPIVLKPEFPPLQNRYGPHVAKIGELTVEFEDETCLTVLSLVYERAGRRVTLSAPRAGVAPIEIAVTLSASDALTDCAAEIRSKRSDTPIEIWRG